MTTTYPHLVIPAKAGIHAEVVDFAVAWTPAYAGVTMIPECPHRA